MVAPGSVGTLWAWASFLVIDPWLSEDTQQVLDLCTGNGSLAVLAALAWPDVTVHATDLSADALALYDTNSAKVRAEVLDLNHGTQFTPPCTVDGGDDISVTAGSDLVVVTAGADPPAEAAVPGPVGVQRAALLVARARVQPLVDRHVLAARRASAVGVSLTANARLERLVSVLWLSRGGLRADRRHDKEPLRRPC